MFDKILEVLKKNGEMVLRHDMRLYCKLTGIINNTIVIAASSFVSKDFCSKIVSRLGELMGRRWLIEIKIGNNNIANLKEEDERTIAKDFVISKILAKFEGAKIIDFSDNNGG